MFYGASDFLYNAKVIALSSSIAVSLTLASLHYSWGLAGLWASMIFVYFGIRVIAHYQRFNSEQGPFGASTRSLLAAAATDNLSAALPSEASGSEDPNDHQLPA